MERPLVSIIILNYNGKRFLKKCLSTVFATRYPNFEVIFVDNASTDRSIDLVSKEFAENKSLKIIRNLENLGFGPANNVGFKHAKGDYIVFLNNDTSVEPEWLTSLVEALENDSTIGLAQSLIFDRQSGNAGFLVGDYWIFFSSVKSNDAMFQDMFPKVFEVSFVSGSAMIIKRNFLQEIGLFDPKYFWFYDDTYLSFRTWLANKRVVTVSGSKIYHFAEGTSEHVIGRTLNRYHIICRFSLILAFYWNLLDLWKGLFFFSVQSLLGSFKESVDQRNATIFWAYLSGTRWVLKNFRYIWRNRLKYWSKAVIDERTLRSRMIRLHIPIFLYLVPKLGSLYFKIETDKYRKSLLLLYRELHAGEL